MTSCEKKAHIEEHCTHHCEALLKEYHKCQKRISSYEQWDYKDLQTEASWKQLRTMDADKKPLPKEELVEQLNKVAHCTPQWFDFKHCIDHCTAPKLFAQLK